MSETEPKATRGGELRWILVSALVVAATVAALYHPAAELVLMGDSYQWVQHAHEATHRPLRLFADVDTFLRPASTWTLVVDRLIWRWNPSGFHVTNLLLHGAVAVLLVATARRLGLGRWVSLLVALIWVASPFTDEPAFVVAYRFQTLFAAAWLALIVMWPGPDETWGRARVAGVVGATLIAAAAKETWVMIPALVVALEVGQHRRSFGRALQTAVPFAIAAALYTGVYFVLFPPGGKSYYVWTLEPIAKVPHQLAVFFHLEQLVPLEMPFTWRGVVALGLVGGLAAVLWYRRQRPALVAMAVLILPVLPTLMVPYLPQRYTALPYAGFLLLIGLWYSQQDNQLDQPLFLRLGAGVVVAMVAVAGWLTVRADLTDYSRISAAHARLVDEAREVLWAVEPKVPIVVVRAEQELPLLDVLRSPQGLAKLPFTRPDDPYGLVDASALFDWALAEERVLVEEMTDWPSTGLGKPGVVLLHRNGGFDVVEMTEPDVAGEAARLRRRGLRLRVIAAEPF
jgi:hypothetical protein